MKSALGVLFCFLALGLAAQETPEWRWALLPLRASDPQWSAAASNVSKSLARVLQEGLSRMPSEQELTQWQQKIFDKSLAEKRLAEAQAREAWDRARLVYLLESTEELQARSVYETARAARRDLEEAGPSEAGETTAWPLKQWPSPGATADRPTDSVENWARTNGLSAFIDGELTELRGYLGLRLKILTPEGKELAAWEEWMSPEELPTRSVEVESWLRGILLDRPWSRLAIRAVPPTAEIWINNTLRGLGAVDLGILEPGTLVVTMRNGGYEPLQESLELKEGEEVRWERELVRLPSESIKVTSEPAGADVWVGGVYSGQTPLEVNRTGERLYVEMMLDGYDAVAVTLLPDADDYLQTLTPTAPKTTLKEARDWFYLSLGTFTISFFTTVMFRGFEAEYAQLSTEFVNYYIALPVGDRTQAMLDKVNLSYTFQQSFQNGGYALMGVTAVLFGWTVWELFRYIQAAEGGL